MRMKTLLSSLVCVFVLDSSIARNIRNFPDNFLFGVATASYQIEGGWNASDKGENIWDYLTHFQSDLVLDKSNGDVACDSYNLFNRDVEMLKELEVGFYRFSLSWTRILPSGFVNKVSADGIQYYNNLIDSLLANGIQPVVTLYHWDLPQSLQELGGWTNPIMEYYFEDFANVCFEAFGDRVKMWLTFNEPREVCSSGYGDGTTAPAYQSSGLADYLCGHYLLLAHARAYHLYQNIFNDDGQGRISLTLNTEWFEPKDYAPENIEAAKRGIEFSLGWFANPIFSKDGDYPLIMRERIADKSKEQGFSFSRLPVFTPKEVDRIRGTFDFFGLNHYTTQMTRAQAEEYPKPSYKDDSGLSTFFLPEWPTGASPWLKVVPWGFRKMLNYVKDTYDNPEIIVFENGYSDNGELNDTNRTNYYFGYMNALLDAIDDGCTVTGYTAWSLMDNFEWLSGYTEHFGLYQVDFNDPNRTRTPKGSAKFYSDVIKNRFLEKP